MPHRLVARLTDYWTYKRMFAQADLVVIATAVRTKDTGERTTLPDYPPKLTVLGVVTDFETSLVLKGQDDTRRIQLHHYRYETAADEDDVADTPSLINAKPHHVFLLFLTKERGGTYAPVTGETDPALTSVLELEGAAE